MSSLSDRLTAADPLARVDLAPLPSPSLDDPRTVVHVQAGPRPARRHRLALAGALATLAAGALALGTLGGSPSAPKETAAGAGFAYDVPAGRAFAADDPRRWFAALRRPREARDALPATWADTLSKLPAGEPPLVSAPLRTSDSRALHGPGSRTLAYLIPATKDVCLVVALTAGLPETTVAGPRCAPARRAAEQQSPGGVTFLDGEARKGARYNLLPDGIREVLVITGSGSAKTVRIADNLLYERLERGTMISFRGPGGARVYLEGADRAKPHTCRISLPRAFAGGNGTVRIHIQDASCTAASRVVGTLAGQRARAGTHEVAGFTCRLSVRAAKAPVLIGSCTPGRMRWSMILPD